MPTILLTLLVLCIALPFVWTAMFAYIAVKARSAAGAFRLAMPLNAAFIVLAAGRLAWISLSASSDPSLPILYLSCVLDLLILGGLTGGLLTLSTATGGSAAERSSSTDAQDCHDGASLSWAKAIDAAGLGLWQAIIEDGRVVSLTVSGHWREVLCADCDEAAPSFSTWLGMVHPGDRWPLARIWRSALQGRTDKIDFVHRMRRRDGVWIWARASGHVIERDSAGGVLRAAGTYQDVTFERNAAAQHHEREQLYHGIFRVNNAMKWLVEPDTGRIVDANPACCAFYGYTLSELTGMTVYDLNEGRREVIEAAIATARAGGGCFDFTHRLRSGELRSMRTHSGPVELAGRPLLFSIMFDMTEHVSAQADLERLGAAIDQAGEVITITNREGVIEYVNPAFERVTGYPRDEAIGSTLNILKSGQHEEAFYRGMWTTIASGRTWTGRIVNRARDGSLFHQDATISPVRDSTGTIAHYVSVNRDVSREVELEAQLRHSQKMEAIGQLAGGIAHDFNNLLQVINGYNDMAMTEINGQRNVREYLKHVREAGKRAEELVRQLLTFSRRDTPERRRIDLSTTMNGLMSMLGRLLGEHIELHVTTPDAPLIIDADEGQIEQIVTNLCVNARDAMPKGGMLRISLSHQERTKAECGRHPWVRPGPFVKLSIADTGCGMSREVAGHIFEPFFTTKEVGRGTGLGLATVYALVRRHGGAIDVETEEGAGTCFHVWFPAEEAVHQRTSTRSSNGQELPPLGSGTVLLAEDDPMVRRLAVLVLSRAGYQVLVAEDGDEALRLFGENAEDIDLAVLDLVMPKRDGAAVCHALRTLRPDLPVLFCSGYSGGTLDATLEEATRIGSVSMLRKPYSASDLMWKVRDLLHTPPESAAVGSEGSGA